MKRVISSVAMLTARKSEILVTISTMPFGERYLAWRRTVVVCLIPHDPPKRRKPLNLTGGLHPHQHHCENLKFRNLLSILPELHTFTSCSLRNGPESLRR